MFSKDLEYSIGQCYKRAREARHEYMTVEHLLLALLDNPSAEGVLPQRHTHASGLSCSSVMCSGDGMWVALADDMVIILPIGKLSIWLVHSLYAVPCIRPPVRFFFGSV